MNKLNIFRGYISIAVFVIAAFSFAVTAHAEEQVFGFMDGKFYDMNAVLKYFCFLDGNCYDLQGKVAPIKFNPPQTQTPQPVTPPAPASQTPTTNTPTTSTPTPTTPVNNAPTENPDKTFECQSYVEDSTYPFRKLANPTIGITNWPLTWYVMCKNTYPTSLTLTSLNYYASESNTSFSIQAQGNTIIEKQNLELDGSYGYRGIIQLPSPITISNTGLVEVAKVTIKWGTLNSVSANANNVKELK